MDVQRWDESGKRCPKCGEVWPMTTEFFRKIKDVRSISGFRWQSYCRACEAEWIADKRREKSSVSP